MSKDLQPQKAQFKTGLAKVNDIYAPLIEQQLQSNGVHMDDYSKQCVLSAIGAMNTALDSRGITWNDPQLDQNNITQILLTVASLKLNAAANPREVYFQTRNKKVKVKGKEEWRTQIEMGIEGDGNDAILANFGRGVKQVAQHWIVRENDTFEYPSYVGLEMTPPKWQPTGRGKAVRVVYPIIKTDGSVDYHIAEREDVHRNLLAHISNNMMNETFGIAKDRFSATPDQRKKIDAEKQKIIDKAKNLTLDEALDDPDLAPYISPAWKDPQSRESMIIRKMRNNITKKIPKDFSSAYVSMKYEEQDDEYNQMRKDVTEHANQELIDVAPEQEAEPEPEPKKEPTIIEAEPQEIVEEPKQEPQKKVEAEKPQSAPKENENTEAEQENLELDF